jgi:hypothetical protein
MARQDKQTDINATETRLSADDLARVNDNQTNNQTNKSKHDRKPFLLLLLMLLIAAPVIVLLANSGFINRTPEPIIKQQPVTVTEIKEVETDLKKVINNLNAINRNPDLKEDHVEVKKIEPKIVPVVSAPVAVKPKKVKKQPEKVVIVVEEPVVAAPVITKVVSQIIEKPSYVKYDINGRSLGDSNEQWACVQDTKNGLMWEVKSKDDAMRKPDNLYSWFDPEDKALPGVTDGGRCKGDADCDTHAYVEVMNKKNFCGHSDWRLPTREEMMALVSSGDGKNKVKINSSYFPQALPSWYWTAESNRSRPEFAWYVYFKNGMSLNDLKENPKHIRLVRSGSS